MISENFSEVISTILISQFFGWFVLYFVLIMGAVAAPFIIGRIFLFKKCGKAGWKAVIPVYGTYVQDVEIAGIHWAFFIAEEMIFFGWTSVIISGIVKAMSFYNLAKKCHKNPVAPAILGGFFSGILTMVYGYPTSTIYDSNVKVGKCSFFDNILY